MPLGLSPASGQEVNTNTGMVCRSFASLKAVIEEQAAWLSATTLTVPPYDLSTDDETAIKTAILQLNTALQGVDMTFINRLIGLPT